MKITLSKLIAMFLITIVISQSYYFLFNSTDYTPAQEIGIITLSLIELAISRIFYLEESK